MIGLYRPGSGPLHRLPAGAKLLGLVVWGALTIVVDTPWTTAGLLGGVLVLLLLARLPAVELWRLVRGFGLLLAAVFAVQVWQHGADRAVVVAGGLLALVLAAGAVTATTPSDALVDALVRALRPLRRLGVPTDRVALAFSLTLRALPLTQQLAAETRDAARARGLGRSPRAYLVPLALRVVAHARETGAALHARGLGDGESEGAGPGGATAGRDAESRK